MRKPTKPRIPIEIISSKIRPPLAIVLGTSGEVSTVLEAVPRQWVVCYQMDLYSAQRLREKITEKALEAEVVTAADLWDLPADFQSILYIAPHGGERAMKLDV